MTLWCCQSTSCGIPCWLGRAQNSLDWKPCSLRVRKHLPCRSYSFTLGRSTSLRTTCQLCRHCTWVQARFFPTCALADQHPRAKSCQADRSGRIEDMTPVFRGNCLGSTDEQIGREAKQRSCMRLATALRL